MTITLTPGQQDMLRAMGVNRHDRRALIHNRAAGVAPKNIPIPRNSEELAEMIADPGRLRPVVADKESLREFIEAYAQQQQGEGTELRAAVETETQRALTAWLKENGTDRVKNLNLASAQAATPKMVKSQRDYAAGHNPNAVGAVLDGKFTDSADYVRTIFGGSPKAIQRRGELMNAFSSTVPSEGGFLIPETLRSQLLQVALEMGIVRGGAFVVPMESLRVPFPTVDSTTNAGSVFGGMVAYWTEEGGALTATSAAFGRVVLEAKKLTGYSEIPNELLSDSNPALGAFVDRAWPEALAFFEDLAFLTGTGVGEPLGMIGAQNPASIAITKEVGQPADTIVLENIVNMYSRMLPGSLNRAVWLASPAVLPELFTMALSVGTGGSAVYLTNVTGAPALSILGRPVMVTEKVPTLGNRGDLAFVDRGYYLVGDRQQMTAETSEHYKFGNDKTAIRIIQRSDGRPWLQSAITPANSGDTLSPFVEIEERA